MSDPEKQELQEPKAQNEEKEQPKDLFSSHPIRTGLLCILFILGNLACLILLAGWVLTILGQDLDGKNHSHRFASQY